MTQQAYIRLKKLIWAMLMGAGLLLICIALSRKYWIYYLHPSEVSISQPGRLRVGGIVKHIQIKDGAIIFNLCDKKACIAVNYKGTPPQMFGEDQEALVDGYFEGNLLRGERILAKHDENYKRKK